MTPVTPAWFGGRNCAVSLTFDDGMDSHLEVVVPALDARGMAGTFYVKTDDTDRLRASASRSDAVTRSATTPSIIGAAAPTGPKQRPGGLRT